MDLARLTYSRQVHKIVHEFPPVADPFLSNQHHSLTASSSMYSTCAYSDRNNPFWLRPGVVTAGFKDFPQGGNPDGPFSPFSSLRSRHCGSQSQGGREHVLGVGANRRGEESIFSLEPRSGHNTARSNTARSMEVCLLVLRVPTT
eukprot:6666639-Pyramimonas_sp.AAC.1